MLIFVTGGVRSGKSSWAEAFCEKEAERHELPIHYIATSRVQDAEMEERVHMHQSRREQSKLQWVTWEQPKDMHVLAKKFSGQEIVLLDCLTNLVSNELFHGVEKGDVRYLSKDFQQHVIKKVVNGILTLKSRCHTLVVVSNEIGYEPIKDEVVLSFIRVIGKIHQSIVTKSTKAIFMEWGIPTVKKGEWHERNHDSRDFI